MYFNTLQQARQQRYDSFKRSAGALFNLCDALLSESQASSLAELSLSPFFGRHRATASGRSPVEASSDPAG